MDKNKNKKPLEAKAYYDDGHLLDKALEEAGDPSLYHETGKTKEVILPESDFSPEKRIRLEATDISNGIIESGVLTDSIPSQAVIDGFRQRIEEVMTEAHGMRATGTLQASDQELFADLFTARDILSQTTSPANTMIKNAQANVLTLILGVIEQTKKPEVVYQSQETIIPWEIEALSPKELRLEATSVGSDIIESGVLTDSIPSQAVIDGFQLRIKQVAAAANLLRAKGQLKEGDQELFADLLAARDILAKEEGAAANFKADILSLILAPLEELKIPEKRVLQ